ncbi:Armadillo-type fold [Pseudocohnilembus persalinus]|uniref:Armadillo-type fold n=1 Tax=Pseudocohnilembus persalinus TaxID=266149 RepID=A0A0V0R673_PSEPJ|nr:Armadillo-type fold [Pseudocohnilembus persalinus]|eukprot:KRX09975.1 Armadillo-type fold [Pseudocohnilembus persalinus]
MDFTDQEEDCTIYIEELKSDDSNLKMNAVVKIQNIAGLLGPNRTREELIPYLIEIIEELDNEDEFLMKLADQLQKLSSLIGGKEFTHILLSPLEILSSLEEISVREKAVDVVEFISQNQDNSKQKSVQQLQSNNYFLPMVKQLAKWDNYPSRISATQLIGRCFQHFDSEEQQELLTLFSELCKDDTPMVRRTAADGIQHLCEKSNREDIAKIILPLWQELIKDNIDSVRVKAIESTTFISQKISQKENQTQIIKLIMELVNKQGQIQPQQWRVRYAIAEVLPKQISYVDQVTLKNDFLTLYDSLLKDSEQEVKSIALQNLPEFCKQLTKSLIQINILPLFKNLVQDKSYHVKSSLGEVICDIAVQLNDEQLIMSEIIPILDTLLKDEVIEVRLMVLSKINLLNSVLSKENVKQSILPMFQSMVEEKQWRYRLQFCQLLPTFRQQLGFDLFIQSFKQTIFDFSKDHYAYIRENNFKNLHSIALEIGFHKIKDIFEEMRDSLLEQKNYIYRVSSISGLLQLTEVMTQEQINNHFDILIQKLGNDKVPNVIISLARAYIELKDKLNQTVKNKLINSLKDKQEDSDSDVSYYAQLIVSEQD